MDENPPEAQEAREAVARTSSGDVSFAIPVGPVALTYWNMASDELAAWNEADAGSIGHGGEWETSLQLYLRDKGY